MSGDRHRGVRKQICIQTLKRIDAVASYLYGGVIVKNDKSVDSRVRPL